MYLWASRRRVPRAIAHPLLQEVAASAKGKEGGIRHLPAGLYLMALAGSLLALGRPVVPLPVPADRSAVMLSIDVSGSMRSRDILPSRLEAAKEAAKSFVRSLPPRILVGLVAFGGYALLLVRPTADREELRESIDRLEFLPRTAIGEGLLEAVAALPGRSRPDRVGSVPQNPAGGWPPGVVVLLSDGRSNTGIDPLEAARLARAQGVTVHTVGVGQPSAGSDAWTIGGPLDEETLKEIARITGGTYHHASSARALREVYRRLARVVGWEKRPVEVTGLVALAGAILLGAAVAVSARVWRLER